jgi:phage gp16-like protein
MRTSELAKIHIAKKQLALDDDTYRDMLWTVARVRSSADLDDAGRRKVLEHMKSRGFKSPTKPDVTNIKKPLMSKIAAQLTDMNLTWAYADGVAKQMHKRDRLQWCSAQELRGVVAALAKLQSKRAAEKQQETTSEH